MSIISIDSGIAFQRPCATRISPYRPNFPGKSFTLFAHTGVITGCVETADDGCPVAVVLEIARNLLNFACVPKTWKITGTKLWNVLEFCSGRGLFTNVGSLKRLLLHSAIFMASVYCCGGRIFKCNYFWYCASYTLWITEIKQLTHITSKTISFVMLYPAYIIYIMISFFVCINLQIGLLTWVIWEKMCIRVCRRRSQWPCGSMLACVARSPRTEPCCGQKFLCFSQKSLRYAALGMGCTLTAVLRSTQPSTLWGTLNEYQPYGWVIIRVCSANSI